MTPTSSITPDQALLELMDGNQRFASGTVEHPRQSASRRMEVMGEQHPIAVVLSCSDSRVPPELCVDQGIGDLFVVRNAGHVVDDIVLGSIEYPVSVLGAPLVLVLGHTRCGAVTLAVEGGEARGRMASIVEALVPAVASNRNQTGDMVYNVVKANVLGTVNRLIDCRPILYEAVRRGDLKIVGGIYHLETGLVEFL